MKPFEINVSSPRGAPMGRHSVDLAVLQERAWGRKVRLQRVPFVDGDYDPGGAYWGGYPSPPLYCAWDGDDALYLRARSREDAKAQLPGLRFYR
jgi:hypothetical protein